MAKRPRSTRRRSVFVLGTFLYLWVMVAIALGTFALLGLARWLTGRAEWVGWPYGSVSFGLIAGGLVVLSFILTRWLLRRTLLSRARVVRAGIPTIVTILALLGVWAWFWAPVAGGDVSWLQILPRIA